MTNCILPDCKIEECSRGLCSNHYQYHRKHGTLDEVAPIPLRFCLNCEIEFKPKFKLDCEFCSKDCGRKYRTKIAKAEKMAGRQCLWCQESIGIDRRSKIKFCTTACADNYRNKQLSERTKQERTANRKPCLSCDGEIPEHRTVGAHYCSLKCKQYSMNLRSKFNLTPKEVREKLILQGGVCAICKTNKWGPSEKGPAVDHNHTNGKIRGLLCDHCNNGLGRFKDNANFLLAAIEYLQTNHDDVEDLLSNFRIEFLNQHVISNNCLSCEKPIVPGRTARAQYCDKRCMHRAHGIRKYMLTVPEYEALLSFQDGVCKICKSDDFGAEKRAAVDHNHETKAVRGLLCMNCNNGLGRFKDDPELLFAAFQYLISWGDGVVT